jgi:hypothetical protein
MSTHWTFFAALASTAIAAVVAVPTFNSSAIGQAQQTADLETVTQFQPLLAFSAESAERPSEVRYCASLTPQHRYITYIYVWDFSESPAMSELLGYRSHAWDFEPVTVRVDNASGEIEYAYDSGHYMAATATPTTLYVDRFSHRFIAAAGLAGDGQAKERFAPVTGESLAEMNRLLAGIPRLPSGPTLSLGWACSGPARVFESGYFSSDEAGRTTLPAQVMLLLSIGIGVLAAPFYVLALWGAAKAGASVGPVKITSAVIMLVLTGLAAALSAWIAGTVYAGLAVSLAMIAACYLAARIARGRWAARRSGGHVLSRLLIALAETRTAAFAAAVVTVTYLAF